jgi:hypothetical protein
MLQSIECKASARLVVECIAKQQRLHVGRVATVVRYFPLQVECMDNL